MVAVNTHVPLATPVTVPDDSVQPPLTLVNVTAPLPEPPDVVRANVADDPSGAAEFEIFRLLWGALESVISVALDGSELYHASAAFVATMEHGVVDELFTVADVIEHPAVVVAYETAPAPEPPVVDSFAPLRNVPLPVTVRAA